MRLHEVYEGVQFVSIMSIAERIVGLKSKATFKQPLNAAECSWLKLTRENQTVIRRLSRACDKYISFNGGLNAIDSEMLTSGGPCAQAFNYLKEIKKQMDEDPHTRLLQATDEVTNSAEMAEIAKQQAFIDLQNSYNEQQSESAEHVSSLADKAVDI